MFLKNIISAKACQESISESTFYKFLAGTVKELNISINEEKNTNASHIRRDHFYIKAIINIRDNNLFFYSVSFEGLKQEIVDLNVNETYQDTSISTKIIKSNSKMFAKYLHQSFNNAPEF